MRAEIWSEITCPWCGLGSHRLDRAVQRLGATGAPHIVVDGRYAIPAAQDTDTLLGILRQVWDETHPTVLVADNDAATCGPDGCAVPAGHAAHA